jgi:hypothetical protein
MKALYKLIPAGIFATALSFTGCDRNDSQEQPTPRVSSSDVVVGPYSVVFEGSRIMGNNTTYTYTITRTGKAQANGLSHFIIGLAANCGDKELSYADVIEATLDGFSYNSLAGTEGKGTGCANAVDAPILKFDNLPNVASDGKPHTYSFTLAGKWGEATQSTWVKFGKNCTDATITGPGCLTSSTAACSLSQGYWFSKPQVDWLGSAANPVIVGGSSYSQAEGKLIWKTGSVGKPNFQSNNARKAFLQVATLKLSMAANKLVFADAPQSLINDMVIAENYLASIPKLVVTFDNVTKATTTNFPINSDGANKEAGDAAGRIGSWISANHCQGEDVLL